MVQSLLHGQASSFIVVRCLFHPASKAALSLQNKSASEVSLKTMLQEDWALRSKIFRHNEQRKISFDRRRLAKMYQTSNCLKQDFCHCANNPDTTAATAVTFCERWVRQIKPEFWSRTNKTSGQNEKSRIRAQLEQAGVVVAFHTDGPPACKSVYFHLGYGNFTSWRFSCLELFAETPAAHAWPSQTLHLHVRGDGSDVQLLVEAVHNSLDLTAAQSCAFYLLDGTEGGSRGVLLQPDQMAPCCVEVSLCDEFGVRDVWRGSGREIRARRAARPAAQRRREQEVADSERANPLGLDIIDVGHAEEPSPAYDLPPVQAGAADEVEGQEGEEVEVSEASEDEDVDGGQSRGATDDEGHEDNEEKELDELLEHVFGGEFADPNAIAEAEAAAAEEPAAAEAADAAEAAVPLEVEDVREDGRRRAGVAACLEVERRAAVPELRLTLPDGVGELRYNPAGKFFRAHCPKHGKTCARRRAAFAGRQGQGRPLGSLLLWLKDARYFANKAEHMAAPVGSYESRLARRREFADVEGMDRFRAREREPGNDEGDEPRSIP